MELQGGEQTPKAQIKLAGHSAWLAQVKTGEHPTVGSPVKPGLHEQSGVWVKTVQTAFAPQTPANVQASTHLFWTQDLPTGHSVFSTHSSCRHSVLGFPAVRAGQEQMA